MTVSIEQKGHPPQFADEHYLVVGREYIMKVFLYDRLDHSIFYNGVCKHSRRRYSVYLLFSIFPLLDCSLRPIYSFPRALYHHASSITITKCFQLHHKINWSYSIHYYSGSFEGSHFFFLEIASHAYYYIIVQQNAVTGERIPIVPPLTTTLSVFITDPISLGCSKVFLPWSDQANIPHYQLNVLNFPHCLPAHSSKIILGTWWKQSNNLVHH